VLVEVSERHHLPRLRVGHHLIRRSSPSSNLLRWKETLRHKVAASPPSPMKVPTFPSYDTRERRGKGGKADGDSADMHNLEVNLVNLTPFLLSFLQNRTHVDFA
jgi:hypothetical protein